MKLTYKQQFIDSYFDYEIIREGDNRLYNATVDTIITASSEKSKAAMAKSWNKFKQHFNNDYKAFSESYMGAIAHYVLEYEPKNKNFNWEKLNEIGSDENNLIHGYLVQANRSGLSMVEWALINDIQFLNQEVQNGNEVEKLNFVSLESLLYPNENDEEIAYELEDNNALYANYSDYHKPHFKIWWEQFYAEQKELIRNKKKAVLTPKFIKYYDNVKLYYAGELVEDDLKQLGINKSQQHEFLRSQFNELIGELNKERIRQKKKKYKEVEGYSNRSISNYNEQLKIISELEYLKEYGNLSYTFAQLAAMKERAFLEQAVHLVESGFDKDFSDWIIKNIDVDSLNKMIYEKSSSQLQQDVIGVYRFKSDKKNRRKKKYVSNATMYHLYNLISTKVDFLSEIIEPTKELIEETKEKYEMEKETGFKVSYVLPNRTKAKKAI